MDGVYTEFVQDGTLYRLTECSNIEIFADRTVYLCVSDADQSSPFGYNEEAYTFDNTTGAISRRENYEGVNALFVLPLDKDLADPEAAEEYLSAFESDEKSEDDYAAWSREADAFMSEITPENIEQKLNSYMLLFLLIPLTEMIPIPSFHAGLFTGQILRKVKRLRFIWMFLPATFIITLMYLQIPDMMQDNPCQLLSCINSKTSRGFELEKCEENYQCCCGNRLSGMRLHGRL